MIDPKDEQLNISLIVEEEFEKLRIDKYLSSILDDISRSSIQKFIDEGRVLVDGKAVKSNFKLLKGQAISLYLPGKRA